MREKIGKNFSRNKHILFVYKEGLKRFALSRFKNQKVKKHYLAIINKICYYYSEENTLCCYVDQWQIYGITLI